MHGKYCVKGFKNCREKMKEQKGKYSTVASVLG